MRPVLLLAVSVFSCTPANMSDNRVMSDGKPNAIITATGSDANPVKTPSDGASGTPAAGDPNPALASYLPVAYNDEVKPMMDQLCTAACHTGAPAPGPVLNTPEALKAALAQVTTAITSGTMPPNAAELSAAEKKLLTQLSISLKNWPKNDAYALNLSDFKITYTPAVNALSTALCVNCHGGDQPNGGLRLETQEQWKTSMPQIIKAIGSGSMPPRIDAIQSPRLVKFLKTWQDAGFP